MEAKFIKYSKALSNISENILPPSSLTDSLSLSLSSHPLSQNVIRSTVDGRMQWNVAFTGKEGMKIVNTGRRKLMAKVSRPVYNDVMTLSTSIDCDS